MKLRQSSFFAACALISASASFSVFASPSASGSFEQDVVRHDLAYERVDGRRADARQHLALRGSARADVAARERNLVEKLLERHTPADLA